MTTENKHDKQVDYDIIKRALNNDQAAYRELLTKYQHRVLILVKKIIYDAQEADDLTQEAFIKAFNNLQSFNFEFAFSTWLFKIATNNCIDYLRKKRLKTFSMNKSIQQKDGETQQEYADSTPTIEREMIQTETSKQIMDAIEKLPPKYRQAIIMRHNEEKSYEEIAEILDLPLGTVKARIFRARELLNKSLRKVFR
ncbi:MAG: sigma-70 family RNA polymerase sigma factor [Calditrichaeota bacterium]|nr:sigma-70 family RNA polymerase sigma factor [Calditrichota bacterium]